MRSSKWVCLVFVSGCSSTLLSDSEQQVADPEPQFTVSNVQFANVPNGTNVVFCGQGADPACSTSPSVQVRWGTPAFTVERSGLGFEKTAGTLGLDYGVGFPLGQLTHFNYPTYTGTWSSGADLQLHLLVTPSLGGAALFDNTITVPLAIDETPNAQPCSAFQLSATPCDDQVTFLTSTFQLAAATPTTAYQLNITGFVNTTTSTPVSGLISEEYKSTSATLMATITEECINQDGDTVCNEFDNCDTADNEDQADGDGDEIGDVCDICPTSETNELDANGECVLDPCPCDADWKNHGEYVTCVVKETKVRVREGSLTDQERAALVSAAAQSSCGQ